MKKHFLYKLRILPTNTKKYVGGMDYVQKSFDSFLQN